MNGPRQNWTHNTLPGFVSSHIETIKGEFSSERSLLFVPIQTIKGGGTSVSEPIAPIQIFKLLSI